MRTAIHPKDPAAAKSQIKPHAFERTFILVHSIWNNNSNYLGSLRNLEPTESDFVSAYESDSFIFQSRSPYPVSHF